MKEPPHGDPTVTPPALFWPPAAYQDLHGRRLDGDVDGVEVGLLDAPHALHVDVQYADEVPGLHGLHGCFAGAVHVPRELGVLDELAAVDARLHRLPRHVVVICRKREGG